MNLVVKRQVLFLMLLVVMLELFGAVSYGTSVPFPHLDDIKTQIHHHQQQQQSPKKQQHQSQNTLFSRISQWVVGKSHSGYEQEELQIPFELQQEDEPYLGMDFGQYEDETVLRFNWTSAKEYKQILSAAETLVLDIWSVREDSADIRINKRRIRDFLKLLPKGVRHESRRSVYIDDLQRSVLATIPMASNGHFFDEFHDYNDINTWLSSKKGARMISVGKTFENRDIQLVRIGTGPKRVVVTSGMHAREWLAISSSLYALEQLLNDEKLMQQVTIEFVPVVNPDGYEYTWHEDRLWRKNRQSTGVSICSGLDIERALNWTNDILLSTACSESFAGKEPLQAVEARIVSKLVKNTDLFIDLASYTQQLISKDATEALSSVIRRQTGRDYQVVNHPGLYQTAGVTSYQVSLPDVDGTGFLVHQKNIEPVGQEVADILKILIERE